MSDDSYTMDTPDDLLEYIEMIDPENIGIVNINEIDPEQIKNRTVKYLHSQLISAEVQTLKSVTRTNTEPFEVLNVNKDFLLYPSYITWYNAEDDLILIVARDIMRITVQPKFSLN